jgi:hypothetical protein
VLFDNVGLKAAALGMHAFYRLFRVNPLVSRYLPRAAFLATLLFMVASNPIKLLGVLMLFAICLDVTYRKVRNEIDDLRAEWDSSAFKKHSAKAVMERIEGVHLRAFFVVVEIVLFVAALEFGRGDELKIPVFCLAMQMVSLQFMLWIDACELPEPHDGDPYFLQQGAA